MIDAYLLQRPHADTVIDFTVTTSTNFSIAILAGLNWLRHCARNWPKFPSLNNQVLSGNSEGVVTLAQRWWLMEGAVERCSQLLANGEKPPLMLYLIWSEYTRLAKHVAAAAVFGPSKDHSAKLSELRVDASPSVLKRLKIRSICRLTIQAAQRPLRSPRRHDLHRASHPIDCCLHRILP